MAEMYARRTALSMTSTIVRTISTLLVSAREYSPGGGDGGLGPRVLDSSPAVARLMPHVCASAANLARRDPRAAVQVLGFVQELLPSVAALNNLTSSSGSLGSPEDADDENIGERMNEDEDDDLPSPHYAWVESDHPYK